MCIRDRKGEGNGRGEEGKGGFGGLIRVCLTYGILITDTHTHTHTQTTILATCAAMCRNHAQRAGDAPNDNHIRLSTCSTPPSSAATNVSSIINTPKPTAATQYKAVMDRRLRPWCCHLGCYFKHPESSPMRPLACKWYYCAQFIAKPKAACALRFSWASTSSNLGL